MVAVLAVRRLGVSPYGREAWAVLAIATLAVPMLTKNNWPYYYLEPFVFMLIWEFASMHDRRLAVWRPGDEKPSRTLREHDRLDGEEVLPGFTYPVAELFA